MSRCFPFPPPGYLRNSDALIEDSIKLRLDIEKPKKDRKEKKRNKEEKKRHKQEKKEKKEKRKREKENKQKDSSSSPHANVGGIKFKVASETKESKDDGKLQKGEDYENEQLERSGITEELDLPVCSPQEPYSSDSSQSSKRKRATLLSSQEHGPAIRIRLPLRKHRKTEESKQEIQLCSSSRNDGIAVPLSQDAKRTDCPLPSIMKVETPKQLPGNSNSKVCKPLQNLVTGDTQAAYKKTVEDKSQSTESLYESLLHTPPITYDGLDSLDEDWLFSSRPKEAKSVSKKQKTNAFQCSESLWPRAQYIPEVGIYALPYTVPF